MFRSILVATICLAAAPAAWAKAKPAKPAAEEHKKAPPNPKALADLAGKYKWGMSPDDTLKNITDDIHARFAEDIKKEPEVYQQDQLRKQEIEEVDKVKTSLVKFDGQKTGWDVSIIDKEFNHKNDESMVVLWEKDQRRFLFFWHDKLYKQFIAFNAEHPAFKGKSFDDFAKLIEKRFGPSEMKFGTLRSKDEQTLDHLEWAPAGDFLLWAIDQSSFYGNFCLVLKQPSVVAQLTKAHDASSPHHATSNALIDSVTTPEKIKGDPNADIADEIIGNKTMRTNQGGPTTPPPDDSKTKKKKK